MTDRILPHVTVAALIEKNNKFLMVFENSYGKQVINQPAGHVEAKETILAALERETLEETGWKIKPLHALGISQYDAPNGITYVRHSIIAEPLFLDSCATLDKDILASAWLSYEEIVSDTERLRSPLVLNDIQRYLAGIRFPLAIYTGLIQPTDSCNQIE